MSASERAVGSVPYPRTMVWRSGKICDVKVQGHHQGVKDVADTPLEDLRAAEDYWDYRLHAQRASAGAEVRKTIPLVIPDSSVFRKNTSIRGTALIRASDSSAPIYRFDPTSGRRRCTALLLLPWGGGSRTVMPGRAIARCRRTDACRGLCGLSGVTVDAE